MGSPETLRFLSSPNPVRCTSPASVISQSRSDRATLQPPRNRTAPPPLSELVSLVRPVGHWACNPLDPNHGPRRQAVGPSALSRVHGNAADRHCVGSPHVRTRKDSNNPRIPRSSPMVFSSGGYSDGQRVVPTPRPITTLNSPRSVLDDTTRTMKPGPWHQSGYSILTVSNMTRPFGRYCWSTG